MGGRAAAAVAAMGIVAIGALHLRAQVQGRPAPAAEEAVRPPADNANTMRPLSANEIPPNLSFYAIDPLYTPGVPLGWAATRIEETLDRGLDAQPAGARGVYLSWRLLKSDAPAVGFDVFRQAEGGTPVKITARPIVGDHRLHRRRPRRATRRSRTGWCRLARPRRRRPSRSPCRPARRRARSVRSRFGTT